jgi:Xaa-Pro aminopeptidase
MAERDRALKFSDREFQRRYLKIREGMQLRDIDCLVVTGNNSFFGGYAADLVYLLGRNEMMGGFIIFPLEGDAMCFNASGDDPRGPIPKKMVPFKNGKGEGRRIRDWAAGIAARIRELGLENGRIGICDMRVMPAGVYIELVEQLPRAKFLPAGDILLECRRIKSAEELEFVRMAGQCADRGFEAIFKTARPGVTEREVVNAIEAAMVDAGAERGNFIIFGAAPWEEWLKIGRVIGRPERKLQKGDLLLNEISPGYSGYYVQQCIPVSLGVAEKDMPESFTELFKLNQEMYQLTRDELRPGTTVVAIEHKIQALTASRGKFSRTWTLQSAEMAEAHFRTDYMEIKAGMTWVNHPWTELPRGVPGLNGHTIGNTLIVTEAEPEIASGLPLDLVII